MIDSTDDVHPEAPSETEPMCKCGKNPALPDHTCPFKQEIHDSDAECNCCADCQYECAMDI